MEQLSYLSLAKHVKHLRGCGFYRLDESSSKAFKTFHMIYRGSVFSFFLLYTIQQVLKIYEVKHDVDKVMGTMFLLLTNTDCLYKAIILWKKADEIDGLLNVTKVPMFNKGDPVHRIVLLRTMRNTILVFRIYNYMSLFTCFLWVLHPTILHIRGKLIEFPIWLPFNANKRYYTTVTYVWIQTSWLAYCNTVADTLVAFLLEQCRTQITILRFDLENVINKSKEEARKSLLSFDDILKRKLNEMILHHRQIISTAAKVQTIFGGAVLYQFLVSGWILCTSAYRMVNVSPASVEFASMIFYIICILIQLYVYCYYGNKITYESRQLLDSAYAVDWLEIPVRQRITLIIFMERMKRHVEPMAGSIIPLSNGTYISILRSSYSFYAFLKNSNRND